MRRILGLVLLVVVSLLAGCNGPTDSAQTGRETLTPVPIDETPTRAQSADRQLAPGLTRDELFNPELLLRHHEARLANTTHTRVHNVTRRHPNGSTLSIAVTRVASNQTAVRIQQNRTVWTGTDQGTLIIDRWSSNNTTYTAVIQENTTTYSVSSVVGTDRQRLETRAYSASLSQILLQLPIVVGEPVNDDGMRVYPIATTERRDLGSIRNVSFTGNVTAAGIITEYRLQYEVYQNETLVHVTVHNAVTVGQDRVVQPDWLSVAKEETSRHE